ncbi:serine/threonine-protein phosphatase 2A regulatory subunit B'' subunit alpha isoform X1 [Periophthalmus magnuspinnatus]|uniref:serine/threonine-protein phosphatase 2A regulatory subunit B'' subunit alpha isoform X1 n=1 Tax=Periophthalmus magnuspinnatus TaxID=409849 RepID=UPI00145BF0C6|nr:serine/threonine-protein phosphatase 2A regulatory subunit B'' subunit alpha isoform X1 [Periophthalmus magnuspinnatus]
MAAAYRVVVSSISCYNSVVVDRRAHSHAVHYCSGPCGALSQGLDCTLAHRGTCSELLVAPEMTYKDANNASIQSRNMSQHLSSHGKSISIDSGYSSGLERAGSSGNLSIGEDTSTLRSKKASSGSIGNLSGSLKDITEEAINLASGKLKEFSFDKLRLSSSNHVTFRKGRKVRPDSFSRRSADLEIIYGHFSSTVTSNGTANGMTNGLSAPNDENVQSFGLVKSLEETKQKGNSSNLSAITKASGGSSGSLSTLSSLDQSMNTITSLYRSTMGEENLIARLLEKTRAEVGSGGGEDIRACLDILLKCSEDLKKCTDIIKQCIRRKAGGGHEDGGASPDSVYRAMMTRLSSYLKRLPLDLEGISSGQGHSELAELVNSLHSLQQSPFSPIFGNEQPPRYEDVVHSPPITKSYMSSSLKPDSNAKSPMSSPSRTPTLTNGLQHSTSISQHTLTVPSVTYSSSSASSSPSHSPLRTSPTPPYAHTPPASPMEALYIEEEDAPDQIVEIPPKQSNNINGSVVNQQYHLSNNPPGSSSYSPSWPPASTPPNLATPQPVTHRNEDIDKLLMDLENLSQSMSNPPLPAKTRKRDKLSNNDGFGQPKSMQFQIQKQVSLNGPRSKSPIPVALSHIESNQSGAGEEEDGALLMRILESIESFAQELVDSGAGSTGSAERSSGKEREVMRLLQDTLASTSRSTTPLESLLITSAPDLENEIPPAIPPKQSHSTTYMSESGPEPPPVRQIDSSPKQVPISLPEPVLQVTEPPTITEVTVSDSTPASLHSSVTLTVSEPVPEAPPPVSTTTAEPGSELTNKPNVVKDTGSTLLIQQTPEVIRVQSKPEKRPITPPAAPAPAELTVVPATRTPSPPPAPVIITPPPPAINIPRFYFPRGLPVVGPSPNHDATIATIETAFTEFEDEKADIYEMGKIAKACGCPLYWKAPMFYAAGGERTGFVSVHSFIATWRKLLHSCHDDASRFISLLAKPGCNFLEQEDFIPLLQDIVDTHPGLTFLKDAPEFHSRYITTVIQRIYYVVNRSWSGRITTTELRRSNFLQTLALLEEEDDINQITDYFSYEHFYVIYCKFWELDTDHDLYIDLKDLSRYNDHASSNRIIERLFSGAVTRGNAVQREGRMSYAEFVWFLISEEDKKNPTSIEYWFRCMDVDGDGVLSMFELEYFYEEQCERMERMGIEPLPFQDLLCQMLDLVKPENLGRITLSDLKRCRMAHIFFDTFFNLEKYLDHEQRDPFAVQKDIDSEGPEPSDWDKYASEEYEILVAEETANEQLHDGSFDDDYDSEELHVPGDIGNKMEKLVISDLTA